MESEEDKRESSDSEEGSSGSESVEGPDAVAAEVEPEVAAARHNYNLRSKRKVPDPTRELELTVKDSIASGAGVEADKNHVGGRDAGEAGKKRGANHDSSLPATRKDKVDSDPVGRESSRTTDPRDRVVDRSGGVAWDIPVTRAKGRTRRPNEKADKRSAAAAARRRDLDADAVPPARTQSGDSSPESGDEPSWEEWDAFRRERLADRLRRAPLSDASPQPNELRRPGDFPRSPDVERKVENRLEPRTSNLLERSAPVEPGRGREFDTCMESLLLIVGIRFKRTSC